MKREWKPGDVALIPFDSHFERAMWTEEGWVATGYPRVGIKGYSNARPLVVIDPEDREQVERLMDGYFGHNNRGIPADAPIRTTGIDYMQAALREFANPTPPKPDEPMGLGAVVEDEDGGRWVRRGRSWSDGSSSGHQQWTAETKPGFFGWSEIAAVRILSEGMQS